MTKQQDIYGPAAWGDVPQRARARICVFGESFCQEAWRYQLRTAVRDAATEKIGSADQSSKCPIEQGASTLSGLGPGQQAGPPPVAPIETANTGASKPRAAKPALSEQAQKEETEIESQQSGCQDLPSGQRLDYALQILNSREDAANKRPQLETTATPVPRRQADLTRQTQAVEPQQSPDIKSVVTAGNCSSDRRWSRRVAMQIVVTDKLAKKSTGP